MIRGLTHDQMKHIRNLAEKAVENDDLPSYRAAMERILILMNFILPPELR